MPYFKFKKNPLNRGFFQMLKFKRDLYPLKVGTSLNPVLLGYARSKAANFSSAVPLPPEIIAPACPIRLPFGAVTPAI